MARTDETDGPSGQAQDRTERFKKRAILGTVGLVFALLGWWIGVAVVPRWWAQRIGDVIDGKLFFGSVFGITIGFFFTMLSFTILWFGWKLRANWKRGVLFVIGAVAASAPNLATLGIVMGDGKAAHAGERILDVDGVGFRGGSVVGFFAAVVLSTIFVWFARSRKLLKERAKDSTPTSKGSK